MKTDFNSLGDAGVFKNELEHHVGAIYSGDGPVIVPGQTLTVGIAEFRHDGGAIPWIASWRYDGCSVTATLTEVDLDAMKATYNIEGDNDEA